MNSEKDSCTFGVIFACLIGIFFAKLRPTSQRITKKNEVIVSEFHTYAVLLGNPATNDECGMNTIWD